MQQSSNHLTVAYKFAVIMCCYHVSVVQNLWELFAAAWRVHASSNNVQLMFWIFIVLLTVLDIYCLRFCVILSFSAVSYLCAFYLSLCGFKCFHHDPGEMKLFDIVYHQLSLICIFFFTSLTEGPFKWNCRGSNFMDRQHAEWRTGAWHDWDQFKGDSRQYWNFL